MLCGHCSSANITGTGTPGNNSWSGVPARPGMSVLAVDPGGICLQEELGGSRFVSARALAMIKSVAASARVVVLNACYSETQADEPYSVVDCVVDMTGVIRDGAARSFAVDFYRAFGDRRRRRPAARCGRGARQCGGRARPTTRGPFLSGWLVANACSTRPL
jgi:hypothetical protein